MIGMTVMLFRSTLGYDSECGIVSSNADSLKEIPVFILLIIFEISSILMTSLSLFKWNSASRLAGFIVKSPNWMQGGHYQMNLIFISTLLLLKFCLCSSLSLSELKINNFLNFIPIEYSKDKDFLDIDVSSDFIPSLTEIGHVSNYPVISI